MNILILYPYYNQKGLMHNFSSYLRGNGIYVDALCLANYNYEKTTVVPWSEVLVRIFFIVCKFNDGVLKRIIRKIVFQYFLRKIFPLYDLVDFHSYSSKYNILMEYCVKKNIKFDITLWGSDLMRSSEYRRKLFRYGFDNCYVIKMTENLYEIMKKYYCNIYDDKCRIVYFGNSDFQIIDILTETEIDVIKNRLYGNIGGKKIVVCGYNGIQSQNHSRMIEALASLSDAEKNSIHVVFPMTYGAKSDYLEYIRSQMDGTMISYSILDCFLELKEVATIRKTANIVLNVQNTDAMAASLQDHLYCGNVCIFGDWLNYVPYTKNDIFYIKTSMNDIAVHVRDVLKNYDYYHNLCNENHDKIKNLFSWDVTILKQIQVYGE